MKWKILILALILGAGLYLVIQPSNEYPNGKYGTSLYVGYGYKFIANYEFKNNKLYSTFKVNDNGTIIPIFCASGTYKIINNDIIFKLDKIKPLDNAFYSFNSLTLFGLSVYDYSLYNGNHKVTIKIPFRIDNDKLYLSTNNIENEFIRL